jgi:hypothetical protein
MRRTLVITALALTTTLGGCVASPYGYYGPSRVVTVEGPTIYPPQYQARPMYRNDYRGYQEQHRWNSWYRCQQVYGNRARCVY